jgi:hypothetical protein
MSLDDVLKRMTREAGNLWRWAKPGPVHRFNTLTSAITEIPPQIGRSAGLPRKLRLRFVGLEPKEAGLHPLRCCFLASAPYSLPASFAF